MLEEEEDPPPHRGGADGDDGEEEGWAAAPSHSGKTPSLLLSTIAPLREPLAPYPLHPQEAIPGPANRRGSVHAAGVYSGKWLLALRILFLALLVTAGIGVAYWHYSSGSVAQEEEARECFALMADRLGEEGNC